MYASPIESIEMFAVELYRKGSLLSFCAFWGYLLVLVLYQSPKIILCFSPPFLKFPREMFCYKSEFELAFFF